MNIINALDGQYEGFGNWYDSAGNKMKYSVSQDNRVTDNGLEIHFKHNFEDGTVTDASLVMTQIAPFIFRLGIGTKDVGRGYCIADSCHYYLKTGEAYVEVSYRPTAEGIQVNGSSTKNADGNYIAWHEELRRCR